MRAFPYASGRPFPPVAFGVWRYLLCPATWCCGDTSALHAICWNANGMRARHCNQVATANAWCRYSGSIVTYKSMERDASGAIRELHAECHPAPQGQKPPKVLPSFPHVRAAHSSGLAEQMRQLSLCSVGLEEPADMVALGLICRLLHMLGGHCHCSGGPNHAALHLHLHLLQRLCCRDSGPQHAPGCRAC